MNFAGFDIYIQYLLSLGFMNENSMSILNNNIWKTHKQQQQHHNNMTWGSIPAVQFNVVCIVGYRACYPSFLQQQQQQLKQKLTAAATAFPSSQPERLWQVKYLFTHGPSGSSPFCNTEDEAAIEGRKERGSINKKISTTTNNNTTTTITIGVIVVLLVDCSLFVGSGSCGCFLLSSCILQL